MFGWAACVGAFAVGNTIAANLVVSPRVPATTMQFSSISSGTLYCSCKSCPSAESGLISATWIVSAISGCVNIL
ncbi:hypothetical protein QDY71_04805 [Kingella negevensis]|uniref:hypothetical protein n=1 Tax=Kingella negevensis TaxID=1522312 RepID=UPI0015DAC187|nr:hypothetical protein [Kingella negevensis]MDK4679239.1 hypothetical protein [Kingella negevensis]MDK4683039.1 hypothetical protein [Kingella negevensis]MDK4683772.1 hypothetical protein [Kingella negevensis]MDK4691239.1 hypothetical protein [Kingella negevensis]MDK4693613.1 hypothetical protein [Kingella negevensis]